MASCLLCSYAPASMVSSRKNSNRKLTSLRVHSPRTPTMLQVLSSMSQIVTRVLLQG
jgi:hypothetical protein